ncbi:radical SAM/SPASM domain-containing protein (plasmid) [Rhizobium acidisoli]|uniref:Radical SAM/SPASM domain-containing protein n=1 Tax=Rhizobium acidisoli TaxID=1538158 RepID=A0AAE5U048_9HYPH|nr:radical SAM/SPASM domain-containing protein [Rhizobium acidisoli]QAS80890.1 radical SAM/SPASM domain-containing protein [Rhizobium acidisoli]
MLQPATIQALSRRDTGGITWDEVAEIALPAGPLALQVSLGDIEGEIYAQWEFEPSLGGSIGQLRIDLSTLDHTSVVLTGSQANPVARDFTGARLPRPGASLALFVENRAVSPAIRRMISVTCGESAFVHWQQTLTPPAQWFYVEITNICNLKCPFCPSKDLLRPRQHMSLALAETVFRKIADYIAAQSLGEAYVQFRPMVFLHVMGEPVLHPRLQRVVQLAHEAGLAVAVFTNVTMINRQNIGKLIEAAPELVTLSVNTPTELGYAKLGTKDTLNDQHERVKSYLRERAEAGSFKTAVDIQYMSSKGDNVRGEGLVQSTQDVWRLFRRWLAINRSIHRHQNVSFRSLPRLQMVDMANPLSPHLDPSFRIPLGYGVNLTIKTACSFGNVTLPKGRKVRPTRFGQCPYNSPFQQMVVFVDGSVSFCNLDYENTVNLGDLSKQSIEALWNGTRMTRTRNCMAAGILNEPVCQRCLGVVAPS